MEYDSRMGIAYDTVFYGVIYYNWEAFQKFFLATYGVKDEEYIYFKQSKKALPQPPSSLYPFFFCDFTKASFLSTYFYDNYRFGHESFMPFFKRLQQNAPALLQALFRYYLGDDALSDCNTGEQFVRKILQLDISREIQIQLINLWSDRDAVFQQLYEFLSASFDEVNNLYESQKGLIRSTLKQFNTEHFMEHLNILSTIDYFKECSKDKMAISLLNITLAMQKGTPEKGHTFILGRRCNTYLDLHSNYYKTSIETLCKAFGNEVIIEILFALKEKEYTVTQLSDKIFTNRQSINRYVLWLLDMMFISVSHKSGLEVYYKLNHEFYLATKDILNTFVDKLIDQTGGESNVKME